MTMHDAATRPPVWVTVDLVIFTVRQGKLPSLEYEVLVLSRMHLIRFT